MTETDTYEEEILSAYKEGKLKSVANNEDLAKFRVAARSTTRDYGTTERRVTKVG